MMRIRGLHWVRLSCLLWDLTCKRVDLSIFGVEYVLRSTHATVGSDPGWRRSSTAPFEANMDDAEEARERAERRSRLLWRRRSNGTRGRRDVSVTDFGVEQPSRSAVAVV